MELMLSPLGLISILELFATELSFLHWHCQYKKDTSNTTKGIVGIIDIKTCYKRKSEENL